MRREGDVISGRYRLEEAIGRGASGRVFRATDLLLGETVALKLLGPAHEALEVARREVRLARKVTHPNVARVFDLGVEADHVFLTMELVSGEPLSSALARAAETPMRRLPLAVVMRAALDLARGLVGVHAAGVVHRDIKPANVLITPTRAVLADFGIALPAADGAAQDASGTPAYMAPEQILGDPVDARTDVYALGLLLYQLVTGQRAHEAEGRIVPALRLTEASPNPRAVVPHLPAALASLVERMLAIDPASRPDAVAVVRAIEGVASAMSEVTSPAAAAETRSAAASGEATVEDQLAIAQASKLLHRYVLDATREAVAVLEARGDTACVEVTALLARALLRLWVQVGGQDDALLLRAEEVALRTLLQDPTNATVQLALATAQHELGSYNTTLHAARQLLGRHPEMSEAYALAGRASFELGALDEALHCLTEATRLSPDAVEPWLDLTRMRALASGDPRRLWRDVDALTSRFGRAATAPLRMRFSFVYRDRARAAESAREIVAARTGGAWESSLPELEALAGIREKTPEIVKDIVQRIRGRRPPPHRERTYHEVMIERLVALSELELAHDWLEHDGVPLGPVWLERCPSLAPLRGQSRFHGSRAKHHVLHEAYAVRPLGRAGT